MTSNQRSAVISQLDLAEFQGLDEEAYKVEEERFIAEHKNSVRLAINKQRNYVQQELRDFMMKQRVQGGQRWWLSHRGGNGAIGT